ncbi:uncharacterized protein [Cherax quadricarinatus]|uniref:uncharacterized protein isoform X2 n=1 Tax=Cherax quadricarinatus TaxID=27406 RepID=UPI00387E8015
METVIPGTLDDLVVDVLTAQHSGHSDTSQIVSSPDQPLRQDVRGESSPHQTRYPSLVTQPSLEDSCDDTGSKSPENVPSTQDLRVTRNHSRSLDPDTHMARTKSRSLDPEAPLTRKNTRFSDHEDFMTRKGSRSLDPEAPMALKKVNSSGATQQIPKQGLARTSSSVTIDLQSLSDDRSRSPSVDPMDVESIVRERSNQSSLVSSRAPTLQEEMSKTLSSSSFVGFQTSDIGTSVPQCRAFANDQRLTEVDERNQSPVTVNDQTFLENRSSSAYLVTRSSQTRVYGLSRSSTPDISNETPSDESSRGSTPVFVEAYDPSPMCVSTQTSVNKSVYGRVCASTQTWSHGRSNMLSKQVPPTEPEETNDDLPVISSSKTHGEAKSRGLQLDCTSRVKTQQKSVFGIKRNVRKNTLQAASSTPVSVKKRRINTSRITSKRAVKKRKPKRLTSPATKLTIKLRVRKYPQHTPAPGGPQAQHARRSKRLPTINNPVKSKTITKSRNVHTKSPSSGNTSTDEAPEGASRTLKIDDTTPSMSSASQPSRTERFGTSSQVIPGDEETEDRTVNGKLEGESCLTNTVYTVPHNTKAKAPQRLVPTAHENTPKRKQTAEATAARKKHREDESNTVCSRNTGKKHHRPDNHTVNNSYNTTEVFEAVENGDLERLQEVIQLTGPTARDQQTGCTLLHAAADSNQPEVLSFLLKLISPNIVNKEGQTPAHLAALKGHTQVLKILLADEDFNLNKRDNHNRTFKDLLSAPLFLAVLSGSVSHIENLLQLGADPDHHSGELVRGALSRELCVTTPRHLARTLDREYMLRWFHTDATRGRDKKNEAEESATCINNLAATFRLETNSSSSMSPNAFTNRQVSARRRVIVSLVSKCQKGSAKVSSRTSITSTHTRSLRYRLNSTGKKLVKIFKCVEEGDLKRLQDLLLVTGPAVCRQQTGWSLLHAAADSNQPEVLSFLLKLISPNIVNKEGQTPAHLAALKGHTQVLKILLADEDFNLNKRDNHNRTFKDLLAAPLFEAVLWWDTSKIQHLLQLGADPDYHAGHLVQGALTRELQVTTPRHLALSLLREPIFDNFPQRGTPKRVSEQRDEHSSDDTISGTPFNLLPIGPLRLNVRPGSVQTSGPDVYRMDTDPRGYVCILSYSSFQERPDLVLEGSNSDVKNLSNVFGKMGYTGHSHCSLTAQETKQVLTSVREMQLLDRVGCAVFIISSHGIGNEKFLTSDMRVLSTQWVCELFKDSECPGLKNKPKLFIFDFCCGYYKEENVRRNKRVKYTRVEEPLQDTVCLYSSSGSFTSYSFTKEGTAFNTALCRTLAQHSHHHELADLYRQLLKECTNNSYTGSPQLHNFGFTKKFFFNPIH